jgi:hypothetical protein
MPSAKPVIPIGAEAIAVHPDGRLEVPDHPIIPFIEGDGTGRTNGDLGSGASGRNALSRTMTCSSHMKMSGLCQVEMSGSGGWKRHGGLTNGNRTGQHEPQGDRPS